MTRSSLVWSLFAIFSLLCLSNCDPLTKEENRNRIDGCGKSSTRKVYKGQQIDQNKAPWSVFIMYHNQEGNSATTCTGTVVSSRHILTATHCFAELNNNGWLEMTKTLDRKNCKDDHYFVEDEAILSKLFIHSNNAVVARSPERVTLVNGCAQKTLTGGKDPKYEYEDYAIIELYEDLDMSSTIQMACVPYDTSLIVPGTALEYNGFGLNPEDGDKMTTGTLRHEDIKVMNSSQYRLDDSRLFLANDPTLTTIACQGDSGGGAVAKDNGKITVVGVLSQTNCAKNNGAGSDSIELYSLVGYYNSLNCQMMGVCDDVGYDTYHQGYIRKPKPKRVFTTPAPKITYFDQNGNKLSDEESRKIQEQVENGGGGETPGGSYYSKSGNSTKYTITIILMGVLFFFS